MGKVITALLGIISVKLITNYLSTGEYGHYTAIYDYMAIFAIVADFGLFTIAVREMAHDEKQIEKIIGNVLSIRTILAILSFGLGIVIAFLIPQYKGTIVPFGILIVSVATIMTLVAGTISSVLQVYLKMQYSAFAMIVGKAITVFYIVATILWWFPDNPTAGFPHLLYAWIIGNFFAIALTYIPSSRLVKIRYRFDWIFWKEVVLKALPYGMALILGTVYFRIGTVIMSLDPSLSHDIGLYGVAMRFLEIVIIIPAFFMNSILPVLTRAIKENLIPKIRNILQYALDFMALAALPTLVGGYLLSKPLVAAISSDEFVGIGGVAGSDTALRIVLFAMVLVFFHAVFTFTLVALGKQSRLLLINLVAVIVNVSLNLYFVPRYSFVAVSVIAVISETIILLSAATLVMRTLHLRPNPTVLIKSTLSALTMGLVVYYVQPQLQTIFELKSLFITVPLGALIYGACLFLTRTLTPEHLALLKKNPSSEIQSDVSTF